MLLQKCYTHLCSADYREKVRTCRRTHQMLLNDLEIVVFSYIYNSHTCTRSRDIQLREMHHHGSNITRVENTQRSQGLKPQGRIPNPQTSPLPWQDLCSHSLTHSSKFKDPSSTSYTRCHKHNRNTNIT